MNGLTAMPDNVRWIGGETPGTVQLFRREFRLEAVAETARLLITADQRYRLRVNGMWFGDGPEGALPGRWSFDRYELSSLLRVGPNFVEIQVIPPETPLRGAALAAALTVCNAANEPLFECVTDESWSCAALPALKLVNGTEVFDAAQSAGERQSARVLAAVGELPWGALHCRTVAPLTRIERLFRVARGEGQTLDPEALLYPDDRCTVLRQEGDSVSCSAGETVNGCWNMVLRAPPGGVIELYSGQETLPAVRYCAKGNWQRFTTALPRRTGAVRLKSAGAGPVEIQSLRLVEAAYPAVMRSSFTSSSSAREERRWVQECAALGRRLGCAVAETAELADLVTGAARIFGAADWACEELSRQLFTAAERPVGEQLAILQAAANFSGDYGAPAYREEWQSRAAELLPKLLELPEENLTLAEKFQLCGTLKKWGFAAEADALAEKLAATWNPRRLAFCRSDKDPQSAALRANLQALAADVVPVAHLASLRAAAAALSDADELLIVPKLPAEAGKIETLLNAFPADSGRAPLYQAGYLLGLRFQQEGTHCVFSPWIGQENEAEGRLFTRFGEVAARWRKRDRILTAEVALPAGIQAEFLPNPSLAGLSARFAVLTREEWERSGC